MDDERPGSSTACAGCLERDARIAELERRLAELERKLAEVNRDSQRPAASFRQGPPKAEPKRPGRKPGDHDGQQFRRAVPFGSVGQCSHRLAE